MDASPSPVPPIERLLAERAWVRAFARSLVSDEASADDLEQQAWVAALEAPPPHGGSPRGWFATVLRRAASKGRRSAVRVGQRERGAARPEAVAATADVVAQAELEHRVVAAVLALDEPYRSTVLLRWYEGLPPREIAARMGVPVETVRSRAQRALARLRDDLDRAHGGRRNAWAVALLGRGPIDERGERAVEVGGVGGGGARGLPVAGRDRAPRGGRRRPALAHARRRPRRRSRAASSRRRDRRPRRGRGPPARRSGARGRGRRHRPSRPPRPPGDPAPVAAGRPRGGPGRARRRRHGRRRGGGGRGRCDPRPMGGGRRARVDLPRRERLRRRDREPRPRRRHVRRAAVHRVGDGARLRRAALRRRRCRRHAARGARRAGRRRRCASSARTGSRSRSKRCGRGTRSRRRCGG